MSKQGTGFKGKNWRQQSTQTGMPKSQKYGQLVVVGLAILALLGLLVYWIWIPEDPQTTLHIISIGNDQDLPEIPFQDEDIAALAGAFGENTQRQLDDRSSFQNAISELTSHKGFHNDTCIIFLSAHGDTIKDDSGNLQPVILSSDSPESANGTSSNITVDELVRSIAQINAKTKLILLDTGHRFQDPAQGKLGNQFLAALDGELSELKPEDAAADVSSVWLITSQSMLQIPLYSVNRQRTAFAEAVQYALTKKYDRKNVSLDEFYTAIVASCRQRGGASAQVPVLLHAGSGIVQNRSDELQNTVALFAKKRGVQRAAPSDDASKKEGDEKKPDENASKKVAMFRSTTPLESDGQLALGKPERLTRISLTAAVVQDGNSAEAKPAEESPARILLKELQAKRETLSELSASELLTDAWKWRDLLECGDLFDGWSPAEFAPRYWHEQVNVLLAQLTRQMLVQSYAPPKDADDATQKRQRQRQDELKQNLIKLIRSLAALAERTDPRTGNDQAVIAAALAKLKQLSAVELLDQNETRMRDHFRYFHAALSRYIYYAALYESLSWFELDGLDPFHERLTSFATLLEDQQHSFRFTQYELTPEFRSSWDTAHDNIFDAENKLREAIKQLAAERTFEDLRFSEREMILLEMLKSPLFAEVSLPSAATAGLQKIPLRGPIRQALETTSRPDSQVPEIDAWAKQDPLGNRGRAQAAKRASLIGSLARLGNAETGNSEMGNSEINAASSSLQSQLNSGVIPESMLHTFFQEQPNFKSVDAYYLPAAMALKGYDRQGFTALAFAPPKQDEMIKVLDFPEEMIVDQQGLELTLKIQVEGDKVESITIDASLDSADAPFEIQDRHQQISRRGLQQVEGKFRITPKIDALSPDAQPDGYGLLVEIRGNKKEDRRNIRLLLPFPDQIELFVRSEANGLVPAENARNFDEATTNKPLELNPLAGHRSAFSLGLLNRSHRPRAATRVTLYPCEHPASLMPGRIDPLSIERTRTKVNDGLIQPIAIGQIAGLASATNVHPDLKGIQNVRLLSPADFAKQNAPPPTGDAPAATTEPATTEPAANEPAPIELEGALLCRISVEGSSRTWDRWFEIVAPEPDYVRLTPVIDRTGLQLNFAAPRIDNVQVSWDLVDSFGLKFPIAEKSILLKQGQAAAPIITPENDREKLEGARLLVHVDGWPRRLIFECAAGQFAERNDIENVDVSRIVPVGVPAEQAEKSLVRIPSSDESLYAMKIVDQPPQELLVDLQTDVSIIEYFRAGRNSQVLLTGINDRVYHAFAFPRRIRNAVSVDPKSGELLLTTKVDDLTGLVVPTRGADEITIQPLLKLDRSGKISTVPSRWKHRVLFDGTPPRITIFNLERKLVEPETRLSVSLGWDDGRGAGVDINKGIALFISPKLFLDEIGAGAELTINQNSEAEFSFAAPKEEGDYYLALRATDRVGNEALAFADPTRSKPDPVRFTVKAKEVIPPKNDLAKADDKKAEPAEPVLHTLKVEVIVGSIPLSGIHKNAKIEIDPPDSKGSAAENVYTFEKLKSEVEYTIKGEAEVGLGGKATGIANVKFTEKEPTTKKVTLKLSR